MVRNPEASWQKRQWWRQGLTVLPRTCQSWYVVVNAAAHQFLTGRNVSRSVQINLLLLHISNTFLTPPSMSNLQFRKRAQLRYGTENYSSRENKVVKIKGEKVQESRGSTVLIFWLCVSIYGIGTWSMGRSYLFDRDGDFRLKNAWLRWSIAFKTDRYCNWIKGYCHKIPQNELYLNLCCNICFLFVVFKMCDYNSCLTIKNIDGSE